MSNELEQQVDAVDLGTEDITADLRSDNFKPLESLPPRKPFVKPAIHVDTVPPQDLTGVFTAEQIIAMSKLMETKARETVANSSFNPRMAGQMVPKGKVAITDFSNVTLDQVYDLDFPIEAKAFMSADVLAIQLKDTNYEARWVNKNPQNLGDKIAKGFTYIEPNDLLSSEAIQTSEDAEGHYSFNDVVAMKIDKATYFRALRAAHERAVSTTNASQLAARAAKGADSYMRMESDASNDYKTAANTKKMEFYDAGITI